MEPVIALMDRDYSRENLREEGALELRNIKDAVWETILSTCRASELHLYHVMLRLLVGIERLRNTSRLSLEWANRITGLAPVFQMPWLEYLFVINVSLLRNIEGIEALQNLISLHLSGDPDGLNPPLRLASIKPIAKLSRLEELTLENIRLDDEISFIASFPRLRELNLATRFERKQCAYLAKRLNAQLDQPTRASTVTNISCRNCGNPLFAFRGRRMPILCKDCDDKRFDKLTQEFEILTRAS